MSSLVSAVWLIYPKKSSQQTTISWSEALDGALCFSWIDSIAKPLDADRYMQFFSKRKPGGGWSKINKEKIRKLTEEGRLCQAGLDAIAVAKRNGSWTLVDKIEELIAIERSYPVLPTIAEDLSLLPHRIRCPGYRFPFLSRTGLVSAAGPDVFLFLSGNNLSVTRQECTGFPTPVRYCLC